MLPLFIGFILFLSSNSAISATRPKAGSVCNKVGLTQIHKGLLYTCMKKSKKLIWSKGVIIKIAAPTVTKSPTTVVTPSPSPSPSAINSPSPTVTPSMPTIPKATPSPTVSRNSTALAAFNILQNNVTNNQLLSLSYEYGAALSTDIKDYVTELSDSAARRYSLFITTPKQVIVHMYTERDLEKYSDNSAFQSEELKFFTELWGKNPSIVNSAYGLPGSNYRSICKISKPMDCTGVTGQAGAAIPSRATLATLDYLNRGVVPHEMFHVIQDLYLYGAGGAFYLTQNDKDRAMPPTFREGGAVFMAFASGYQTFENYEKALSAVKSWNYADFSKELKSIQSPDDVVKLLVRLEKLDRSSRPEYLVGAVLHEWLIASYGLDKYITLIQKHNHTIAFAEIFKSVYGLPLIDVYRQAADHIYTRITQ